MSQPNTHHGILWKDALIYLKNKEYIFDNVEPPHVAWSVGELCQLALEKGLTHLWVMWESTYLSGEDSFRDACLDWDLFPSWKDDLEIAHKLGKEPLLRSITGFKKPKGGQKRIQVIFTANTEWPFAELDFEGKLTPGQLLMLIAHLEHDLGVTVGAGPGTTGWRYLEKMNEPHPQWLSRPQKDLAKLPFKEATPSPLLWSRPLAPLETDKKFIHKIDKNSMYLRACVEEMYGTGEPMQVDGSEYQAKLVGVWRISHLDSSDLFSPPLPWPFWWKGEWAATPMVKAMMKMGFEVEVEEGWIFPQAHGIFKAWAQNLWRFRQSYPAGDPKRADIKEIANKTIGLISYTGFEMETNKNRPDWRCQTVAGAYASLFYNMMRWALEGLFPVLISTDALLYLSDEEDYRRALPGIEEHEGHLGGFKHVWTLPLDEDVKHTLALQAGAALKMGMLNKRAKELAIEAENYYIERISVEEGEGIDEM